MIGDNQSTIFLVNYTSSINDKIPEHIGITKPTGSSINENYENNFYNPIKLFTKYGVHLNKLLGLPNPEYGKTLLDICHEISSNFVKITYITKVNSNVEIIITKFSVTFITLTLNDDRSSVFIGSKILLGITLNKEESNLTNNTYDYSFKK